MQGESEQGETVQLRVQNQVILRGSVLPEELVLFIGVLDSKSYRALFGARILALHQYENQRRKEEERLKID